MPSVPTFCEQCGKPHSPGDRFCQECGHPVPTQPAPAPPPPAAPAPPPPGPSGPSASPPSRSRFGVGRILTGLATLLLLGSVGFYRSPAGQKLWRTLTQSAAAADPADPNASPPSTANPPATPAADSDATAQRWLDQGYAKEKAGDLAGAIHDYRQALQFTGNTAIADRIRQLQARLDSTRPAPAPQQGTAAVVYKIGNIDAVASGVTAPNIFTTHKALHLTRIMTYHWNNGRGSPPGLICLDHEDGTRYGPWQAAGEPGQGGVPNASWIVKPNLTIKPGNYTLLDSDPATWSQNAGTKGRGMCEIQAVPQP